MPVEVRPSPHETIPDAGFGWNGQTKGQVSFLQTVACVPDRRTLRSRKIGKIRDLLPFKAACKRKAHASGEPKELAYTFSSAKFSQTRPTKCLDLDSFGGKGAIISSSGLADLVEDRAKVALRSLKAHQGLQEESYVVSGQNRTSCCPKLRSACGVDSASALHRHQSDG